MLYNTDPGEYSKNFVQELKCAPQGDAAFQEFYKSFSNRILWIDENVVPGSMQMNTAWYYNSVEKSPVFPEHEHPEDEIIGFFGSNPDDKNNLNAEITFSINGESRTLTKSTLIFVPGGVPHAIEAIKNVKKPVFHFSLVRGGTYDGTAYRME